MKSAGRDEPIAIRGARVHNLKGVDMDYKLGDRVTQDLVFTDFHGERIKLADLFDGRRPVVLQLGYYECPMLCGLVFQGLEKVIRLFYFRWDFSLPNMFDCEKHCSPRNTRNTRNKNTISNNAREDFEAFFVWFPSTDPSTSPSTGSGYHSG